MQIRIATHADIKYIIDIAEKEGWNPGMSDSHTLYYADPNGFFIGEINGEIAACIAAVKYPLNEQTNQQLGFLSYYNVSEKYRGQGYGKQIWNHAMKYLKGCIIGLDAVLSQEENYKLSGFKTYQRIFRVGGIVEIDYDLLEQHETHIKEANSVDFTLINSFDQQYFPTDRQRFIKAWLNAKDNYSFVYIDPSNGAIHGHGAIRKCSSGYKIGPLFAETPKIAEALFLKLSLIAQEDDNEIVIIDVFDGNPSSKTFADNYDLRFRFEMARMWNGNPPDANWNHVYDLTSYELG